MILKSETYNFHRLDLTRQAGFIVTVYDEDGLRLAETMPFSTPAGAFEELQDSGRLTAWKTRARRVKSRPHVSEGSSRGPKSSGRCEAISGRRNAEAIAPPRPDQVDPLHLGRFGVRHILVMARLVVMAHRT